MEDGELREILQEANDLTNGIIRSQAVYDELVEEIEQREINPFEEDYIFRDHYGEFPFEAKEIEVGDAVIRSRVLHRRGSNQSDIKGADLLYEIEGVKYLMIQYKSVRSGKVKVDRDQLQVLMHNCSSSRCSYPYFLQRNRIDGFCGSWYCARGPSKAHYMHACEVDFLSESSSSIRVQHFNKHGMERPTFESLIAKCRIGAPISPSRMAFLAYNTFDANRILLNVVQSGTP